MAWSKAKTAIGVGLVVLLAAGATTITVKEIREHQTSLWALPKFDPVPVVAPTVLWKTPPQVRIVPSKYNHWVVGPFISGDGSKLVDGKWIPTSTNASVSIGVGVTFDGIVQTAYGASQLRTVFLAGLPKGRYDYIANLQQDALKVLREQIQKKYGLIGRKEMRDTDVLVLKLSNPDVQGFKPPGSLVRSMNITNIDVNSPEFTTGDSRFTQTKDSSIETRFNNPIDILRRELENEFRLPIVDETGLTNRYDFSMTWPVQRTPDNTARNQAVKEILLNQLGLELVLTNMPIEMLVVEKVK